MQMGELKELYIQGKYEKYVCKYEMIKYFRFSRQQNLRQKFPCNHLIGVCYQRKAKVKVKGSETEK